MRNPHLPEAPANLAPDHTRRHRKECGPLFHQACLELSQSFWLQGKPAQAILQLNRAAFVPDRPAPFPALVWFLLNRRPALFLGNPVRHFQHLASRMAGDHAALRTARAWACFHLARSILPPLEFPPDEEQLARESLEIPTFEAVSKNLPPRDASRLSDARALANTPPRSAHSSTG